MHVHRRFAAASPVISMATLSFGEATLVPKSPNSRFSWVSFSACLDNFVVVVDFHQFIFFLIIS